MSTGSNSGDSSAAAATPQFLGTTLSSICALLPRPLVMTGLFRDWMIRHFADPAVIEDSSLRRLIWKPGQETAILIESIHRWRPELTEKRPAVLVKRNAYSNLRVGVGDRRQGPPADGYGDPHYATYWVGSHTLFCLGGTGAEAELLSTEVQRELTEFGPFVARSVGLMRWQVLEIGQVQQVEEATENFVVPVTVGYTYEQRWVIHQQAPRLKRVSLSMLLEC
jgi:hypothetical protein